VEPRIRAWNNRGRCCSTVCTAQAWPGHHQSKDSASFACKGIDDAGTSFAPDILFGPEAWSNPAALAFLLIGGVLVGFGTRWANGCTSGHAISGLSAFQWPSLIAVAGFLLGGLIVAHLILPLLIPLL